MSNQKKWYLILISVLVAIGAFVFYPGIHNAFVFDDIHKIRDNPDLSLRQVSINNFIFSYRELKTNFQNDPSRPITFFTYWILWQLGEGTPEGFHFLSIGLHILNSFLVALICFLLVKWVTGRHEKLTASLSALMFFSLPLSAGTVIYAYGLSDVLSTFFLLLGLYLHLSWNRKLITLTVIMSVVFALACFSKQSALVLPAILLLTDYFSGSVEEIRKRKWYHIFLFSLVGIYLVYRYLYFGKIGDLEAYDTFDPWIYAPLQGIMILKYLLWTWWPLGFSIDHANSPQMYEYWQCWLSWGMIVLISLFALVFSFKKQRARIFAWGWFFFLIVLSPTSSFFPTTDLLVERRAYLATVGILIATIFSVLHWVKKKGFRNILSGIMVCFVGLWAIISRQRVQIYGNEESLWKESKTLYPRNERARINLSTYYLRTNQFEAAESELTELLKMYPDYFNALANMGAFYQHPQNPKRDPSKAVLYYQQVLAKEPYDLGTLRNLGLLYLELDQYSDAMRVFHRMVEINENNVEARTHLLEAQIEAGLTSDAESQAIEIIKLDPENQPAQNFLKSLKK